VVHLGATSHRIFKISELARFIAGQLVPISRNSAVSLACACRYLEEPVLSTLWETQPSLNILLEALPEAVWEYTHLGHGRRTVCDLDPRARRRNRMFKFWTTLVQHPGESAARGLEQSPALCVLDAPGPRG